MSIHSFPPLSPAARVVWAKHDRATDDWLPLWRHMADSGAVAGKLWDAWVPHNVRRLVAEALPQGEDDARRLVVFLAASHDVGKATPAFACQVDSLANTMRDAGLDMETARRYGADRRLAPHGLAGQLLLQEWFQERHGWGPRASGQFAVVAGGHHGTPPEHQQIHALQLRPRLLRHEGAAEQRWRAVQYELIEACAQLADVGERFAGWRAVRLPQPAQVVLTAIVIVSDWIASSAELFPYDPRSWQPAGPVGEARRLRAAWEGLDLPGPWTPEEPRLPAATLFAERFDLPGGSRIRPVQAEAVRLAREMAEPGLLVIEAPMGEGKTEAAFAAAEVLAARTGAGGLLVALPTRATSDAMFPRLIDWLERLPQDGPRSLVLAHGKAALNELWAGMLRDGRQGAVRAVELDGESQRVGVRGDVRREPAGLHAHQWLRGRKKSLLASFAVGTIDQVLFAGLKSRHLALRHLAVAGKVVVIDEVHAYDAYMNRYLDRVLEWLAAYRVPVVLLSATLPANRRQELAAAYARTVNTATTDAGSGDSYPLLTAVAPGTTAVVAEPPAAAGREVAVSLERLDDDLPALVGRLRRELDQGGCALVVRNTVDRVLEAADALTAEFGDEAVTVAHSRFLAADRASRDARLRKMFGRDGERPAGPHIVVASQVVEQSLDVDFDLLVTDLAPVDLMLQRMGRLHRHPRQRPTRLARPRCLVTGVSNWRATPPTPISGSVGVYQLYPLLRSLAALTPHLDGEPIRLPDDISPLVQAAYADSFEIPAGWEESVRSARERHDRLLSQKRERAEAFLLGPVRRAGRPVFGWLDAGVGDADDTPRGRAQVRDSEESLEVLVVQRRGDGRLTTVPWLDPGRGGLELPRDFPPDRRAAEAVAASALTLPWQFTQPWVIDRTIEELERFVVPAWQVKECPWLAGELILVLDEDCQTRLAGFLLRYSERDGLRVLPANAPAAAARSGEGARHEVRERERAQVGGRDGSAVEEPGVEGPGVEARSGVSGVDEDGPETFDLTSEPWLPVLGQDGLVREVSLREVFARADEARRLVGELATQDIALLRLLLAILYDALNGPATVEDWEELWQARDPFAAVPGYLDEHREAFDLLHPERPFFQVAGLETAKGEVSSLNRIVADVPAGEPFFSMRQPGVERLTFAEAARWLVHAHAFDVSGIKSGMRGDERAKAGKVYPLGVGSVGGLGGVVAEGATLRQTLLLNLIALDEDIVKPVGHAGEDLPAWRHPPYGPGEFTGPSGGPRRPGGLRDLYTWQSRRVRLHWEGDAVTGVVLGYGDPLKVEAPWTLEPMTGWRRSRPQEKKQRRPLVYMPRQHDPDRAAWRGLESMLPSVEGVATTGQKGEPDERLPSGIVKWLSLLTTNGEVSSKGVFRVRTVGAVYGTQQSVIDEVVDDHLVLPVLVLHQADRAYSGQAIDAVAEADRAVRALGHLAANLARAAGSDPVPAEESARDRGFGALDGPYRRWLAGLGEAMDLTDYRQRWRGTARAQLQRLARESLNSTGRAALEGREADVPGVGRIWVNAAWAEVHFRRRLTQALPRGDEQG
ncbi:type I-E CRISPR-associated protein Cse1/CasA [Streptomyces sp. 3MP-14]|uniref:Type I-E CRISPR-associated protein Cse1/CasA n=1 Tax=Streptomyces mimosae TaxID=2586635 RepID=A0A5N6ANP2_9ACTN|nr:MULTISPECIES: type I-E CRISPR-associated protein Cse1/CasA [Streptomyces]KAB8169845.1 type I-E CRISPR-associated protein Cse1/CasA [Streptomyces mimosae]KAB8178593.1 type I-E CRISPR-associated protein Cse1/CasA [Streptomyces sp. 3MP-14]